MLKEFSRNLKKGSNLGSVETPQDSFTDIFKEEFFYQRTTDIITETNIKIGLKFKDDEIIHKSRSSLGFSYISVFNSFTFINANVFASLLFSSGVLPIIFSFSFDESLFSNHIKPFLSVNNLQNNMIANNTDVLLSSQQLIDFFVEENLVTDVFILLIYHSLIQIRKIPVFEVYDLLFLLCIDYFGYFHLFKMNLTVMFYRILG
jgi:hypothetical protein